MKTEERIEHAQGLIDRGDLYNAAKALRHVLCDEPKRADVWHKLGGLMFAGEFYGNAYFCYSKAKECGGCPRTDEMLVKTEQRLMRWAQLP